MPVAEVYRDHTNIPSTPISSSAPSPLYLVGPTGSGKSALAVALAEEINGEIVNADAYQLYRGLDICTAKPSAESQARVPHHLYDVLSLSELGDAAFYAELALPVIADIASRGRVPIIVGGSGLYVKALTHGLTALPSDQGLREQLGELTPGERVVWLKQRDPEAEETVNLKNDRYVTRALEICLLMDQPQSALRKEWSKQQPDFSGICLVWERPALNARIHQRVLDMVDAGLVDEIRSLGALSDTAEKAIGVREICRYLTDECSLEQAISDIQVATRQYAKRQGKWFKREKGFQRLQVHEGMTMEEMMAEAMALYRTARVS